jgi:hypothetical protein
VKSSFKLTVISAATFFLTTFSLFAQSTQVLEGVILDSETGEPVIGASLFFPDLKKGAVTDIDGNYKIDNLPLGKYRAEIGAISYQKIVVEDLEITAGKNTFNIVLDQSANLLAEATVTSARRMNSEIAVIMAARTSATVISGMSGREIGRSQDRNAAEVVRRIPGVSVIGDRYIIVRGLPSRYNNVWINNSSVPSTEADSRSFSFDMLPSSQLESILIVKSQSADLPSDFSGGFVKITTGSMPEKNELIISYGTGINTVTHFNDQLRTKTLTSDYFRISGKERGLSSVVPVRIDNNNPSQVTDVTKRGFREDWSVISGKALPDQRFSVMLNSAAKIFNDTKIGISTAINYTRSSQSYTDMLNARFGVYNVVSDNPEYIYKYTDNQYSLDTRLGGMVNISLLKGENKIEFRNTLNILGKSRYTEREGWQNVSARYNQQKQEYLYTGRLTYTGQIAGNHKVGRGDADWNIAYSFAGMEQPDRRIINREENMIYGDDNYGMMAIDQNEITRDFVSLKEHIVTPAFNFRFPVNSSGTFPLEIKTGIFGEYKTRNYTNRQFFYRFNRYSLPSDFVYGNVVDEILKPENYSADKLYIYEDTDNRNSYKGENFIGAGYLSFKVSKERFTLLAGLRAEAGSMILTSYDKIYDFTTVKRNYDFFNLFPSLNGSYNINKKELIRVAYGKSVNRPEFREISSSVYYDFNLFSDVKGNPSLKQAVIHNLDIRYERYPSTSEYVTLALFYKHFVNPIEWTYLDAGGSYTYTFENAKAANNWGIEADIKRSLDFAGLKNFSAGLNAAYIFSKVSFDKDRSLERDRAMQGQSPYIINASVFYDNGKKGISAAILYNRIGKRIVGIGRADTGSGASVNNDVPDTYELSRDIIDLTISKKIGKTVEIKLGAKDILNQKIVFEQYPKYLDNSGNLQKRNQVSKSFKPGSSFTLAVQFKY